jgi:hypothetical protein
MSWCTTEAVAEFLAEAGEFLHAEPARNTVILSVTENLRLKAPAPPGGREAPDRGQPDVDPGATEVVLYTDLANPTSNALYERLGYRPVEDRTVLTFQRRDPATG